MVRPDHELARSKSARFAYALQFEFVGLHSHSALHYRLLREASDIGRPLNLLPFSDEFDVVYSNAVLHWVQDHESALAGIGRSLRSGGRSLLQMGEKGNGAEVIEAFEQAGSRPQEFSHAFFSADEYRLKLRKAGLTADSVELIPKNMVYPSRAAFTGWLRTTWLPYHRHVPESQRDQFLEAVTDRFAAAHPPDANGAFHARMVRLQVSVRNPV